MVTRVVEGGAADKAQNIFVGEQEKREKSLYE
jgi:hypothetical protein